jgi:hypothetical protein
MTPSRLCCAALLAACLLLPPARTQFGGPSSPPAVPPVKSDLPYIRCGACEALAKNAYRQVKAARDALKPGKKARLGRSPSPQLVHGVQASFTPVLASCLLQLRGTLLPPLTQAWRAGDNGRHGQGEGQLAAHLFAHGERPWPQSA